MNVGTFEGRHAVEYDQATGVFTVGGTQWPMNRVRMDSDAGKITWVNEETRVWFYTVSSSARPDPDPKPRTSIAKLTIILVVIPALIALVGASLFVWSKGPTRQQKEQQAQLDNPELGYRVDVAVQENGWYDRVGWVDATRGGTVTMHTSRYNAADDVYEPLDAKTTQLIARTILDSVRGVKEVRIYTLGATVSGAVFDSVRTAPWEIETIEATAPAVFKK